MKRLFGLTLAGMVTFATAAAADELSKSVIRPTLVTSGVVAGNLPGSDGSASYYISVDLQQGILMTQLAIAGRANIAKKLSVELLDADARVAASTYVIADLDPKAEVAKSFPIDSPGRYVIRLTTAGPETGTYCLLMGGAAMPNATAAACPATAATRAPAMPSATISAPAPAPVQPAPAPTPVVVPPRSFEVISSKCEERLRIGSDLLFDFDRSEVRSEAESAIAELAQRIAQANNMVMIEGHTDAKGSESYNQDLSERRAAAVRTALVGRGLSTDALNIRGFGKSRPVAPNRHADGSDDPDGRQRNRRVEVVINTCS
jgi:outer membrane protein OmpA-like peptidoglycan-associated protein